MCGSGVSPLCLLSAYVFFLLAYRFFDSPLNPLQRLSPLCVAVACHLCVWLSSVPYVCTGGCGVSPLCVAVAVSFVCGCGVSPLCVAVACH